MLEQNSFMFHIRLAQPMLYGFDSTKPITSQELRRKRLTQTHQLKHRQEQWNCERRQLILPPCVLGT
ncbi:hypothetical protein Poly41_40460 [Novipirellula artificiosorum]|uniref:Uncharacterized protein n=1 Tax=Novipirellula artificiosorum TaxID=2528016 RepID=A0A5C6DCD6_9BACT|nr:hypothetical protein Poly41_40460 [Novipirellula artificiosorum]